MWSLIGVKLNLRLGTVQVTNDWNEFFRFLGVLATFLLIVYYATSYQFTPLKFIFRKLPFKGVPYNREPTAEALDVNEVHLSTAALHDDAEEILDRVADVEIAPPFPSSSESGRNAVDEVLYSSAHSASKLAAKMERRINTHLILGVLVGLVGLSVWYFSFFRMGLTINKENMYVEVLPRITILFFIELLAGFFLRQYRIGVEDLKYFLELQRRADAKRIAYTILYEVGDGNARIAFAKALMDEKSDTRLGSGETTTTMVALEKEQNEVLKAFSIAGEKLSDAAKLLKDGLSKR